MSPLTVTQSIPMRSQKRLFALLAAVLLVGASGCTRIARSAFQSPTVELRDVVVKGVGFQGGSLDVVLDVYNPNDYRIDTRRVTYTVFADTVQVATGAVDKQVTLENRRSSTVTLPVTFSMRELTQAAGVLLQRGSIEYTVVGEFTLATPFGSLTKPYRSKGRYDSLGR